MVLFPKHGKEYWIVTDIWETFVPVPVMVCRKGKIVCSHILGSYKLKRRELYRTKETAKRVAAKLNRKENP